jgi:hypothetical protein
MLRRIAAGVELERAGLVQAFFFQRGDCDAFFLADGLTAFESLSPFPWVKMRGVEIHIRHDRCEYDRQSDVDELDVFHARLDGGSGLWGNLSFSLVTPRYLLRCSAKRFYLAKAIHIPEIMALHPLWV